MTEPRTKYPLESFGPELMAALLKGGLERIVIPFFGPEGKKKAHNFQRRIHTMRRRMADVQHPNYMVATRARVSLFWGESAYKIDPKQFLDFKEDYNGHRGAVIVIQPHDMEFRDVLTKAGVEVTGDMAAPIDLPTLPSPAEPGTKTTLEDLLDELTENSNKGG